MDYKIAIASGKGGTGKTTVAVSLYRMLTREFEAIVQLVDCDVEEPNDVIFFPEAEKIGEEDVLQKIPQIDVTKCTFCRACAEYCAFNAIVVLPTARFAEVNPSLCHSCGACLEACQQGAISEYDQMIGKISDFKTSIGEGVMEGRLRIGSSMQTMFIKELKKKVPSGAEITIYDAPPGTSCSVVETTVNSDYVLLVTEPTPFGLYDLKLTVELMHDLNKEFGVIVNKAGLGNDDIYHFIEENNIDLVGEIPFVDAFATTYAQGNLDEDMPQEITDAFYAIVEKLKFRILVDERDNHTQR
ncbi:P-loop NTPase [Saccharicrinis sp. 156]|uniref:nucleotide-binding protein n=1 Tax=Saccharicrinis sp. 156 TaxID=3417574 RepID=UPI003D34B9B7